MIRYKNGISRGQIAIDKFLFACQRGNDTILGQLFSVREVHPDAVSEDGKTALTLAIIQKNYPAVKILLKYGADINKASHVYYHRDHSASNISSYDETPLNTASRLNYYHISRLLIDNGANVNIQSECRPPQGVEKYKDRTALHFAAESGSVATVQDLVQHGSDVNITDKHLETALHVAVRCKSRACDSQTQIVSILLHNGALPNLANKSCQVPLYLAAFYGCQAKAKILIDSGADVNFMCSRDNSIYVTALHVAAAKNRYHLARLLIERGAKLDMTNALDYTPLQLNLHTLTHSNIASLLILHGADMSIIDYNGFTIMATLIHNMRLDCEVLAELMVYAGYNLNHDLWMLPHQQRETWITDAPSVASLDTAEEDPEDSKIPVINIPHGRVERLCDWLRERQTNTASLTEICRISIRKYLSHDVMQGTSIIDAIQKLPLPQSIIHYLLLKDICDLPDV